MSPIASEPSGRISLPVLPFSMPAGQRSPQLPNSESDARCQRDQCQARRGSNRASSLHPDWKARSHKMSAAQRGKGRTSHCAALLPPLALGALGSTWEEGG